MADAAAKIRSKEEAKIAKRERAEADARAKSEAEIKEKEEKMRKSKAKAESEFTEKERVWAEEKAKEKADIARIAENTRQKSEFKARARNIANTVNRAEVEAAVKNRFSAEIQ